MTPNTPSHNEERTGCEVCENCVNGKVCKDIISSSKDEKVEKIIGEFDKYIFGFMGKEDCDLYLVPNISSLNKHWVITNKTNEIKDFLRQSLQSYGHSIESEVRGICRKVYVENVDWSEWGVSDEEAGEKFDEEYEEAITTPVKPLQD